MSKNLSDLFPPGGGVDGYDDTQIKDDLAKEVEDRKDGDQLLQDQIDAIPDSAGMVIQPTEPTDPVTGLQWMDSTTGRIWIWDEDKWLEFPAGGSADAGGGGGGAWELLAEFPMAGVSMIDYPHVTDEFSAYMLSSEGFQSVSSMAHLFIQFYEDGSLISTGYEMQTYFPTKQTGSDTNQTSIKSSVNGVRNGDFGRCNIKMFGPTNTDNSNNVTSTHAICEYGVGEKDRYNLKIGRLLTSGLFTGFQVAVPAELKGTFRLYGTRN